MNNVKKLLELIFTKNGLRTKKLTLNAQMSFTDQN